MQSTLTEHLVFFKSLSEIFILMSFVMLEDIIIFISLLLPAICHLLHNSFMYLIYQIMYQHIPNNTDI